MDFVQTFYEMQEVERVDIPATSGDMGVLSNHVPTIQQLRPGVIDVSMDGGKNKKFFGINLRTVFDANPLN